MLKKLVERYDKQVHRFLEILPGTFSWTFILFPFWGAFWIPHYVAYYIIFFDILWFYKSGSFAISALTSHIKMNASEKYNWLADAEKQPNFKKMHHLIVIPTYKEPLHTIDRGLESIENQEISGDQISVVLAFEKREGAEARKKAKALTSKDADGVFSKKFLTALTYKFLADDDRHLRFWQPIVLFYTNIWKVPAPIRVMNTLGSIWQTGLNSRTDKLINFSIYSTSLKLLDEVGYWDVDVIPEDFRIFFKSYFAKDGNVEVDPIFLPVYADAAESTTYWKSLVNFYEQEKRWAWGVSDDAYFLKKWMTHTHIPFWKRTVRVFRVLSDHFLWPVSWFAITLGATVPVILNPLFAETVMGQNLPRVSFGILTSCWLFLATIIFIDLKQRPKREEKVSFFRKLMVPLEFFLLPVVTFIFTALPGIDAHTRLMLGKYLEYRVTEKV